MPQPSKTKPAKPSNHNFPVVGIGASAGGLDAYKQFLKAIPENSGMAYILVQHLDPTHESMLSDILSKHTQLPVHQITDNINLVPDHIYILPANKLVVVVDGHLKLKPRSQKHVKHKSIDFFLTSLAEAYKENAAGIVLSGTGTDGTAGLQAIKEAGGITIVQEPQSAAYADMPQSAIDAGAADFILPPEKMPQQLLQLDFHQPIFKDDDAAPAPTLDEKIFRQILSLIRLRRIVDFTYYKQSTIKRRIARRMAITNNRKLADYLNFLKANTQELDALFEDLLIPVTSFFRDEQPFHELKDKVFPVITKGKSATEALRVWVAGCSTGEEVYSIAISLYEFLGDKAARIKIQFFGTDISEKAILEARSAVYTQKQIEGIPASRLQQFFTKVDGHYQVAKFIRDLCVFANHNFLKDPPFSKMDLISCRNVLIYMEPYLQKKALATFHYALNEKGFLLLGKSETTGSNSELFAMADKHEKIYSKKNVPAIAHRVLLQGPKVTKEKNAVAAKPENLRPDFQKTADELLLQEFTPACVIINEQADIVHFRGDTSPYLTSPTGKPSLNLFKMARQGLGFELRNALHKAKASKGPIIKEAIPVQVNKEQRLVNIQIIPLPKTIEPYYLVLFQNSELETAKGKQQVSSVKRENGKAKKDEMGLRIQQLERELAQSREDMRAITEDQEVINEELQSANEELLSGSEELQSLNEELETSKEELQSANEELNIVNQELNERNLRINDARAYSDSIIATIREPLVILNKDLRIRSANKSFYATFQVKEEETEGKLLYELGNHHWDIEELRNLLQNIVPKKTTVTGFEVLLKFPELGQRIMILNASLMKREADHEQLILLAIEDVTEKKVAEKKLEELNQELETKVEERSGQLKLSNEQLQQSNDDLQQFAHVASHDLKEPLRKIKTFSNRLADDGETTLSEKGKTYLQKIQSAVDRMAAMIDGVLTYSSMNASENEIENIDLNQTIKNIEADLEVLIQQKKATITSSQLPQIEGASVLIYQLFYNLINNALKFSKPDEELEITISSKIIRSEGKDIVKITIKDNGIGFDESDAGKIFNSFTRLNPKEKFEGTGLGLALCKKIVERHGGSITASGTKNVGAEFILSLPLKQKGNHI